MNDPFPLLRVKRQLTGSGPNELRVHPPKRRRLASLSLSPAPAVVETLRYVRLDSASADVALLESHRIIDVPAPHDKQQLTLNGKPLETLPDNEDVDMYDVFAPAAVVKEPVEENENDTGNDNDYEKGTRVWELYADDLQWFENEKDELDSDSDLDAKTVDYPSTPEDSEHSSIEDNDSDGDWDQPSETLRVWRWRTHVNYDGEDYDSGDHGNDDDEYGEDGDYYDYEA